MKQTFVRIICLTLTLVMLATLLVACQGGGTGGPSITRPSTTRPTGSDYIPDNVPDSAYYNGEKVRIFTRSGSDYLELEFKGNESMNAKLHEAVMNRNDEVEVRLGVKLDIIMEPGLMDGGNPPSSDTWLQKMKTAALNANGNDLFDIAAIYASQGSAFAAQGCFLDVNLLPEGTIDLDKVWWNQSLQDELEIDDALFMLGGDISFTSSALAVAVFYNKNMYEQYFANDTKEGGFQDTFGWITEDENRPVTLYDIVNEYEWTIDVFSDLASKIYINQGATSKGPEDTFGLVLDKSSAFDAWIAALNIEFISKNASTGEIKLAFEDASKLQHANNAYNKIHDLITSNKGVYTYDPNDMGSVGKFADGEAMFVMCSLSDAESFRDTDDWDYGILPMPKFDNGLDDYATLPLNYYSLIVVAANLENDRAEMVGYTLELLAAESYRQVTPAYYNAVLKSDYSDRPEDADMYDIVIRNIKMEFATIFSTVSLEGIAIPIRMEGDSFSSNWKKNDDKYISALDTLISGLKLQAQLQKEYSK